MTHRFVALFVASLAILVCPVAPAQGLRPAAPAPLSRAQAGDLQAADYIVAIVNSEPITNNEVRGELRRVTQQLTQQRRPPVDSQALARQVLETLINQKAQLQLAREVGIRVDDAAVDQAEQTIARQNQIDVPELRRRLGSEGVEPGQFRTQLREQMMLTQLREREVESRVRVSELEIDQYLREQQDSNDLSRLQLNLAQILVAVPDSASQDQVAAAQSRARLALERARAGDDFAGLVREFSEASDRANGGQMGLRTADRYPALFVEATKGLAAGDISDLVRSGAGFHILRVVEKSQAGMPAMTVTQSHARHILLRIGPQRSESAARAQLEDLRRRIVAGQADFASLARESSQDGSAAQGGDLGWASPGMFVPEFEVVLDRLAPGQISEPVVSRFGVHLIQLMERRDVSVSPREQREMVRAMLREKKLEEALLSWAQDLRGRAYVELREPPQ